MMMKTASINSEMAHPRSFLTKGCSNKISSVNTYNHPSPPPPPPPTKPKNEIKDNITRIIMTQDIIEGFWEENKETKNIIKDITIDKFNKIKNNVIALNKGAEEIKIIYTILIIYYLNTKCTERLNEFRLVLSKAYKYLVKNGVNYQNIISGI